ncbi:hypothetical protein LTR09_003474 [Extremus antarcticus]|uniref:Uncharacterized protein n=1 Tax=Extremus antarcticus TaxID=702011 RepID=A0AAJ0DJX4_9PEZI|nr:hypothetical protein LTR09_003474 [Extremus antarcticus]
MRRTLRSIYNPRRAIRQTQQPDQLRTELKRLPTARDSHSTNGESPTFPEDPSATSTVPDVTTKSEISEPECVGTEQDDVEEQATPPTEETDAQQVAQEAEAVPDSGTRSVRSTEGGEVRQRAYITFQSEDAEDYTTGPARMVCANDGVSDCAALLMTIALSQAVKRAVDAQRIFTKVEMQAEIEEDEINDLENKIISEISNHEMRLCTLENDETSEGVEQKLSLGKELDILGLMQRNTDARRRGLDFQLKRQAKELRRCQGELSSVMEEAFIDANLLEPALEKLLPTPQVIDLQTEYQSFCEELRWNAENDHLVFIEPLDMTEDKYERPPVSAEEQARDDLLNTYWRAQQRLQEAEAHFDNRERQRYQELQANFDAADRGEETLDATPDDFDLRWVQHVQNLTHELVEAEAAFTAAKQECVEAGVDVCDDDRISGFVDDAGDGYRMSFEQDQVASVPSTKIRTWLSSVDELASPSYHEPGGLPDDWDAEEADISDSRSLVAEGSDRRRIEKWRQICGL